MERWTKEYGEYHFQVGIHQGNSKYYAEILVRDYSFQPSKDYVGWRQEEVVLFDTEDEAYMHLSKYGYHNVGRFLNGDEM